jgi:lysozyme
MNMTYSKTGEQLTERFEGVRLVAYQDSVGVWTIGYGHTRGVHAGMTCTKEEAVQWLLEDMQASERNVNEHVAVPLTQGEFDALVDFDFNLGDGTLDRSSLLKDLNHGNYEAAADVFEQYDRAGGKVVAGLLRRRVAEAQEFTAK